MDDQIASALGEHIAETGGGFLAGYLMVIEALDANGEPFVEVRTPEGQRTSLSLGMAAYAREWLRLEAQGQIALTMCDHEDDE